MQITQILKLAHSINDDEQVNKIILTNLIKQDLTWLYANLNTISYDADFLDTYLALVAKYASGYPLGYIFGYVFFTGHKILVDQNVLIPRNETELLVERTLFHAAKIFNGKQLDVLDLGTGSGCIAVSLALKNPDWNLIASDISSEALAVAASNKALHQLENIKLVASDLFTNLKDQQFDLIVSNPPYIDHQSNSYQISNLSHEPDLALFAENFGLEYYQRIFSSIAEFSKKEFLVALEIGFDQKPVLEKILQKQFPNYFYQFENDYQQHWRFLFISSKVL